MTEWYFSKEGYIWYVCWWSCRTGPLRFTGLPWRDARRIFHARRWMPYNLFFAGLYIIDDIHYLRRWEADRLSAVTPAARAGGCSHGWRDRGEVRCIIRQGGRWSLTSWRLLLVLLVVMMLQTVELCSHALQRRLSSVQTRAASAALRHRPSLQPPASRRSHALAGHRDASTDISC